MKVYILNQVITDPPQILGFYSNLKKAKSELSKVRRKIKKDHKKTYGETYDIDGLDILTTEIPISKKGIINSLNNLLKYNYYETIQTQKITSRRI